jgi:hypothetical protein
MNKCSITPGNGGLILKTPYEPSLVADLKSRIPASERKFDPNTKSWVVAPTHSSILQQLVMTYFNEFITVPQMQVQARKENRLLEVRYLGTCKLREDGQSTASAWVDGEWKAIFPEDVLRIWFELGPTPTEAPNQAATFYALLGISKSANQDEVRGAFRRMARQWHPDVCKEPNAHEMFIRIKEASDVLIDPGKRARYDAGLVLEASLNRKKPVHTQYHFATGGYRSPLRCGLIMAEGTDTLGRFIVSKILLWEDILRGDRVLVASWPMGAKEPVEEWV